MNVLSARGQLAATVSAIVVSLFIWNSSSAALRPDTYPNFKALSEHEKEGVDYSIQILNRKVSATIFAIHGGMIESFTSEIARSCAGSNFNLYLFEGIKPKDNGTLHITSENFDEPGARSLAAESTQCISIHGFVDQDHETICVGGGNAQLKARFFQMSEPNQASGTRIEIHSCSHLPGTSPQNIVNRCQKPGLQLELSSALRTHLKSDPALLQKLSEWVRFTLN